MQSDCQWDGSPRLGEGGPLTEGLPQDWQMRFVWITREIPLNPDNGQLIYSNGLIRGLLKRGATGKLVAYGRSGVGDVKLSGLTIEAVPRARGSRIFSLVSKWYSDSWRFKSRQFERVLGDIYWPSVDVVVIDYFSMGWVLDVVEKATKLLATPPVLVHVSHNYESLLRLQVAKSQRNWFKRWIMCFDARKAGKIERRLVDACDLLVVNTDEDKAQFQRDAPQKRIVTLTPAYDGEIRAARAITSSLPRRVVAVGSFEWVAKQSALRRFLQKAEQPFTKAGIELLVVGRISTDIMQELTSKHPFCRFTGCVDDVKPYIPNARIGVVVDDIGGGFKHKLLYYIFGGVAAAAIRSQAAGLPVNMDRDIIARDSIEDLVAAIVEHIDDIPTLDEMRERCWQLCARAFSWDERGARLAEAIWHARNRSVPSILPDHQPAF